MPSLQPKPSWLKVRPPTGERYQYIKGRLRQLGLATVCEEARCPNVAECWGGGTATIMVMGDTCTRGCRFCAVKTNRNGQPLDPHEPEKVAGMLSQLELDYVVITSVDRDDLPDQGAGHFAAVIREVKSRRPDMLVEVLIPDFRGDLDLLGQVVDARPDVIAHNVETVERLTPRVRDPRAGYRQSMEVLEAVKAQAPELATKTSLMLGLGETTDEVQQCLRDLRAVNCEIVTFGQYLQPTSKHLPVESYVTPEAFAAFEEMGVAMGFRYVASGPLVRSSYRAGELFIKGMIEQRRVENHA
ncbi:MAG: lipoyl synthase [Candidatus Sericytochromatia bacterium]|nr:lipoyl synthase [Candidatus Sericytochromatia bacterium]